VGPPLGRNQLLVISGWGGELPIDPLGLAVMELAHEATRIEHLGWGRTLVPMSRSNVMMALACADAEPSPRGETVVLIVHGFPMSGGRRGC
jgi:hypothetical protein